MTTISPVQSLEGTLHKTNEWLARICDALGDPDRRRAYTALRSTLHALRDRLQPEEAVHLGAQLPMLVRGLYYEGWRLAGKPLRIRTLDEFLEAVEDEIPDEGLDPELAVRAVFAVLGAHVSHGEIDMVRNALPAPIRALWPD